MKENSDLGEDCVTVLPPPCRRYLDATRHLIAYFAYFPSFLTKFCISLVGIAAWQLHTRIFPGKVFYCVSQHSTGTLPIAVSTQKSLPSFLTHPAVPATCRRSGAQ